MEDFPERPLGSRDAARATRSAALRRSRPAPPPARERRRGDGRALPGRRDAAIHFGSRAVHRERCARLDHRESRTLDVGRCRDVRYRSSEDDAYLGGIDLRSGPWPVGEIGYGLCADVRGRGLTTRALRLVATWDSSSASSDSSSAPIPRTSRRSEWPRKQGSDARVSSGKRSRCKGADLTA